MKGFVSTLTILLLFFAIFSLASTFSTKSTEYLDIPIRSLISDKVYNKFISIVYGVERILEEESSYGGLIIKIHENNFSYVTLNETIPTQNNNTFKTDMERFRNFTETKFGETNLVVDLNFTEIENCLPLNILPYNISYTHPDRPTDGPKCLANQQEEIKVLPDKSWNYVNSYTMIFEVNSSIGEAGGSRNSMACKTNATLTWNITVIGNNTAYNEIAKINPSSSPCSFIMKDLADNKIIDIRNEANSTLNILLQPGFIANSSLTLNLTDIAGKITVGLSPQAIKVKETLYQIEKNDTVYISGD